MKNFFRRNALIDIHSHIIPNIDDGAASFGEAAVMLRLAAESGTTDIVATPHYYNAFQCTRRSSKAGVTECFEKLKVFAEKNNIPINLYLGAETFGVNNMTELIRHNEIISINSSRYVLVEFDFNDDFQRVRYCVSQLISGGYVPVIAHPERYHFIHDNPPDIFWFLEHGCLLQVNKGSILGRYGEEEASCSRWLVQNRFAFAIASDAHSPFRRTTDMSRAYEWVFSEFGKKYADELFELNPKKILHDLPV